MQRSPESRVDRRGGGLEAEAAAPSTAPHLGSTVSDAVEPRPTDLLG